MLANTCGHVLKQGTVFCPSVSMSSKYDMPMHILGNTPGGRDVGRHHDPLPRGVLWPQAA